MSFPEKIEIAGKDYLITDVPSVCPERRAMKKGYENSDRLLRRSPSSFYLHW